MTRAGITAAQGQLAADLANHVMQKSRQALTDAYALCPDPKVRANIALRVLAGTFGDAAATIDIAEGRPRRTDGLISPEAQGLCLAVFESAATTAGLAVLAAPDADRDGDA